MSTNIPADPTEEKSSRRKETERLERARSADPDVPSPEGGGDPASDNDPDTQP